MKNRQLEEGTMDAMLNNRKAQRMPSKNTFKFVIRDETRISGNKSR